METKVRPDPPEVWATCKEESAHPELWEGIVIPSPQKKEE